MSKHRSPSASISVRVIPIAARGGVIGLCLWGPLILKKGTTSRPTHSDFIVHINRVTDPLGSTGNIGTDPDHERDP